MWSIKAMSALPIDTWTVNEVNDWINWEVPTVSWEVDKVETWGCCWLKDLADSSEAGKAVPGAPWHTTRDEPVTWGSETNRVAEKPE